MTVPSKLERAVHAAQIAELQSLFTKLCDHVGFTERPKIVSDLANYLTPKMAMHVAGVSRSAIQKMIKKKQIKSTKVGNRIVIEADSLVKHLSVQTNKLRAPKYSTYVSAHVQAPRPARQQPASRTSRRTGELRENSPGPRPRLRRGSESGA